MNSRLNPYINFKDTAKSAMEFYQAVLGGELTLSTFKDAHMAEGADGEKIMHAMLEVPNGMVLMASDAPPGMSLDSGATISLSLSGDNEPELRGYWDKLIVGGQVTVPLEKAPWGDLFGMLTDKFGVKWMVNITGEKHN